MNLNVLSTIRNAVCSVERLGTERCAYAAGPTSKREKNKETIGRKEKKGREEWEDEGGGRKASISGHMRNVGV